MLSICLGLLCCTCAQREVRNLTTSWNDGTLIAALVDAVGPGLFPGHGRVDASTNLKTTTKAMQLAEDWLGVPQVSECILSTYPGACMYCLFSQVPVQYCVMHARTVQV